MRSTLHPRSFGLVLTVVVLAGSAVHAEIVLPTPATDALIDAEAAAAELPPANDPGAPPRLQRQLAQMTVQADNGEVDAMLRLGWIYYNGQGVNRSYSESYRRFQGAAAQGNAKAMLAAGFLLSKGYGVGRDPQAARQYFADAAQAGYPRAWYLQSLLEDDIGSPKGKLEARQLVERAAAAGDPLAASALASLYERSGQPATARLWYRQAQTLGSERARRDLERMGEVRQELRDNAAALQTLRQRSAAGNGAASYELAGRHHRGEGVPVNYGEAVRLYRLGARQGSAPAQRMLSLIVSKSTAAEPLNASWMLELSRLSLPETGTADADAALPDGHREDPLSGLLNLRPGATDRVINGTPGMPPFAGEATVGIGISKPPPAQSQRPSPVLGQAGNQAGNLQRARQLREQGNGSR